MPLFLNSVGQYSSSHYEVARGLLRSRRNQAARAEDYAKQLRQLIQLNKELRRDNRDVRRELEQTKQRLSQAQHENKQLRSQSVTLPDDPPLPGHSYGPKKISLCIKLAKRIGFRSSVQALKIVLDWLGVDAKIPSWTSVRSWACRLGVAQLDELIEPHDDWIWMADHSNQIGKEKILAILGIRASELPEAGKTLRHQDMRTLAVIPGTEWKRDDVREQYKQLATRIGTPRMLLTDAAVELRESADVLEKTGQKPILLRDTKHFAANAFERLVGKNDRFQRFLTLLGRTRSAIQQTELGHFTPPPQKPKARFMNMEATLRWSEMVSRHLSHPHSDARKGITAKRFNEKLGWMRSFRDDIRFWSRCQAVIRTTLNFINKYGLYREASQDLKLRLDLLRSKHWKRCDPSDELCATLISFVAESAQQLAEGERGWLSTEILESSFGRYKGLEGQHSKGGFTSLVAAFPALLLDCNADQVREGLRRVPVRRLKEWLATNLGTTLASKRTTAYKEFMPAGTG